MVSSGIDRFFQILEGVQAHGIITFGKIWYLTDQQFQKSEHTPGSALAIC